MSQDQQNQEQVAVVPAPWTLRGNGYALLYTFKPDFIESVLRAEDFARYKGSLGVVGFMDYSASDVGSYGELYFIPGRLASADGKPRHTITKTYVSSGASLVGGRANWGIPKERAYFQREERADNTDIIKGWVNGAPAFELVVKPGIVRLPVNSQLCPIPVAHRFNGNEYQFSLRIAAGRVSWMEVVSLTIDAQYFPDVSGLKPVGAIKISDFLFTAPVPKVLPL